MPTRRYLTRLGVAPEGLLRRRVSPGRAERIGLMAILVLATAIPIPVLAQGVVVQGRVFQFGSTPGIANATVDLEGHGSTLTSAAGTFRFEDVDPGEYTLRVEALGYTPESRVLVVGSATVGPVLVPLRIAPLPIDSLTVELRTIDIKGRVRDAARGLLLADAEILTNQVAGTQTDAHGSFKLEGVLEGVPLRVIVRPYGYLRVDTIFVPNEDEDYVFEPVPDPWVENMIAEQILDCAQLGHILDTTLPQEVELIEFLFFDRLLMLRIYTREFMQEMFDRSIELRAPTLAPLSRPPVCL